MAKIFISYKRKNKSQVFQIVENIEKELGVKCWVDINGIESSAQFASVICKAIDEADVVLFMHSSIHLDINFETDWTIKELNYAQAKKKRIVLVKLDHSPLDNIFLMEYGTKNNIDSHDNSQIQKLMSDLCCWLNLPESKKDVKNSDLIDLKLHTQTNEIETILKDDQVSQKSIEETNQKADDKKLHPIKVRKKILGVEYGEDLYGYADKTGKVIIPCEWKEAFPFCEGRALVRNSKDQFGFIDGNGKLVIPCTWRWAQSFSEGLAHVTDDNWRVGFIDKMGKIIIPCQWKQADKFQEGLAWVLDDNGKKGYIDKTGRVVIPNKWSGVFNFHEGLARVVDDNGKMGFIDNTGKVVIPCKWKTVEKFIEGLARVENEEGLYGYIDKTGVLVIPCQWVSASSFCEGLAIVKIKEDSFSYFYCFIDKTGKIVLSNRWTNAQPFKNGRAWVYEGISGLNGKGYYIDKTGKMANKD